MRIVVPPTGHGVPEGRWEPTFQYVHFSANAKQDYDPRAHWRAPDMEDPLFGGTPFRDAHTESGLAASPDARSYYALLNVDQDATESQIRDAYKTLASLYR